LKSKRVLKIVMNKLRVILILLFTFILNCNCKNDNDVFTFKVISFTEEKYNIYLFYENKKYLMKIDEYPLYIYEMPKNEIVNTDEIKYHFGAFDKENADKVIDEEDFQRVFSFNISTKNTYNHVFKNEKDFYEQKYVPRVYLKFNYTNFSELFDDRFVSTVVLNLDDKNKKKLDKYHNNPKKDLEDIKGNMIYISPFVVKKFKDVSINLSGNLSIKNKKLSYKISDIEGSDGDGLYNRKSLKLRANQNDYSYLREKLVYHLADSLGIPTQGCTFTRLVINKKGVGLFTLIDNISNYHFLRQVFSNKKSFDKEGDGVLYKVDDVKGSDGKMEYFDDNPKNTKYDAYILKKSTYCKNNDIDISKRENEVKKNQLIPLFQKIKDLTVENINDFEKNIFDVETYLRSIVLDYICQGIDNYLYWADNYFIFKNANKKDNDYRWYFIGTDYHLSFGIDGYLRQIRDNFYNQSSYNNETSTVRQPLTKLLELDHDAYTTRIDNIIKNTVEKAFNPYMLFKYIDTLVDMIKEDVKWDLLLDKVNPNGYATRVNSYDDFIKYVTDTENTELSPLPLKTYINIRSKFSSQEVGATLPKDDIDTSLYGYTEPKYASRFEYDEEYTTSFSINKYKINAINIFFLILSIIIIHNY